MVSQYNSSKTMGRRTAQLVTELNARRRTVFTLADVEDITRLSPASARSLVSKSRRKGLVTQLKPGLYSLVPFELGHATEYVGDPYLLADQIVSSQSHYLSHGSALELHRMTTQPILTIYVSCVNPPRSQKIGGYDYRFVRVAQSQIFGTTKLWLTKEQPVLVSDIERTVIDGLRQPQFSGGIGEVAKGLWMKRDAISTTKLLDYAKRLDIGAVTRRLGFLLELYDLADKDVLAPLQKSLTATYQRLDPILPAEGPHVARWRLQLNVSPDELRALRSS